MKTKITALVVAALFALPAAAGATTYKGRTSSGHPLTMKIEKGKIRYFVAGIRSACIPIQGGGINMGGVETFGFRSHVLRAKPHNHFTLFGKAGFGYREVTQTHDLWLKRRGKGYTGRMRLQYQFMISKFTPGTFSIYSCLGGATFKAKPVS
jgi:hypothetical protein